MARPSLLGSLALGPLWPELGQFNSPIADWDKQAKADKGEQGGSNLGAPGQLLRFLEWVGGS